MGKATRKLLNIRVILGTIGMLFGVLAAVLPARLAAQMDVVSALKYGGS